MTKLVEWLLILTVIFTIWVGLLTGKSESEIEWYQKWFPLILVFLFGVYSALVVFYRVFTFNNCESAAIELQKQIEEAKTDLKNNGIQFKE